MTTPIYNPNVPENINDTLDITQPDFLGNFQSLFNTFLVNHVSLTAASNAGNHNVIQLKEYNEDGSPQTDKGEFNLYTLPVEGQTDQLFLRYQQNGQQVQMTNYQLYQVTGATGITSYFTFLPGKIIVYFGTFTGIGSARLQFRLQPAIMTNVISVSTCPLAGARNNKACVAFSSDTSGIITNVIFVSSNPKLSLPSSSYIILGNM